MPGGVYDIYLYVLVGYRGVLRHDGDAALTLDIAGVHDTFHDFRSLAEYAALL